MARGPARRRMRQKLMYEYRIEPLKCDRDAMKQECRLARIACSGTQPPTHFRFSEKIQRAKNYCPQSFERDWYKKWPGYYYYYYYLFLFFNTLECKDPEG